MKEKFVQFIEEHGLFVPGQHLVVGVSGGADSVCLLHLLCEIRREWRLTLSAVHVDHGIRGREAKEDARFSGELARKLRIPFFLIEKDVPGLARELGRSVEETGRGIRYQEFERIRRERGADWIAVAHHENDQAETVLYQMLRGSGARGLTGMAPKRGRIVRPLLGMARSEIERYLDQEGIPYRRDSTNGDIRYARNYIRTELLPQAERRLNRQAVRHLAEMAEDIRQWREYIERQAAPEAERLIRQEGAGISLDITALLREDKVIRDEVLHSFFMRGIEQAKDVSRLHYKQACELLHGASGKQMHLPGRTVVERRGDKLFLYKEDGKKEEFFYLACDVPSVNIVDIDGEISRISLTVENREDLPQEIPQKDYTKWLDYDKIKNSLVLRNPREGDFFILDREGHRKKLSRYYIDQKLPASERGRQLVLAEGSRVLWCVPGRISADCKITESTKHVLVVTRERIQHEGRNQGVDHGRGTCGKSERTCGADQ